MFDFAAILDQLLAVDLTPIVLAMVLGGLIGIEREFHGRPAGMRTHMLVCLCSTVLIIASRELSVEQQTGASIVFDPQRLAAGIVTGIGFLGAAAVVRAGDMVRGVTTGAAIWGVAGLGVVIGQKQFGLAVAVTAAYLFVLIVLDWLPRGIGSVVYRRLRIRGHSADVPALAAQIRKLLDAQRFRVQEVTGTLQNAGETFELVFHVRCRNTMAAPTILSRLSTVEGVRDVEWVGPRR